VRLRDHQADTGTSRGVKPHKCGDGNFIRQCFDSQELHWESTIDSAIARLWSRLPEASMHSGGPRRRLLNVHRSLLFILPSHSMVLRGSKHITVAVHTFSAADCFPMSCRQSHDEFTIEPLQIAIAAEGCRPSIRGWSLGVAGAQF
jgi:hypothetical protein